ncbi:MAG: DedA family protein [Deltaproteobacteria bacterium]|nr:DedA family protein [Deltaproteobacteria bacterium]
MLSFLASTVIPLGSEWLLVKMLLENSEPFISVFIASTGNYLGALTTYYIGFYGSSILINKVLRISDNSIEKAKNGYKKYGLWSLLFSWVPVIGDPLCLVGGLFGIDVGSFSVLVLTGKFIRYSVIAYITLVIS